MLTLLALHASTFAAIPLSASSPLPGDDTVGRAAGTQDQPALVEGDGTTWLLVWRDTRASLAGTLGSDATDVYGIRLDADGAPLDSVAFPVASGPWSESTPRAAWGGDAWFVAYEADAATASYWSQGVYGRRVDTSGVVMDAAAILLADAENQDEALWDVASDGDSWAILWQAVDAVSGSFVLDGTTVSALGTPAAPTTVYRPPSSLGAPVNARLAWSIDRYLAAWSAWGDDDDIEALTLDSSLGATGRVIEIVADNHSSVAPALAAGDDGFYVAWFDDTFGAYWCTVRGTPVSTEGVVAVEGGESLSGEAWPLDVHPDVAWMGGAWGVGWEYGAAASIAVSLVDEGGALDTWLETTGAYGYTRTPTLGGGEDQMISVWATYGARSDFDLKALTVGVDGALGAIHDVSLGAPAQTEPAIAGGSEGYLVVATSETADETAILAWRTDARGVAVDAGPIEIARGVGHSEPAVAWNGSVWLVVWTDLDDTTAANGIVGVRVDPDGTVLDASPIAMLTGTAGAVAASTAGDFFVAGVVPVTYDTNQLQGVRVSTDGVRLDGAPRLLGSNYAEKPDVSAFGTGWLVTWAHRHSHNSGLRDAVFTVVAADGTPTTEELVRTTGSVAKESGVNVATDGNGALIVWSDNGDVRGRFVDNSGALVGDANGFVISSQSNEQFDPDVAWDGTTYVVAWTDWRAHPTLEPGEGDVYATTVDVTGAVGDVAGTVVDADDVPAGNVVVAGADGRSVFFWTRLVDAAPFGAFRLQTAYAPDDGGPSDTGDTGVPADTGDTSVPGDTGETGDTEVPGDTGAPEDTEPTVDTDESDDTDDSGVSKEAGCSCGTSGRPSLAWALVLSVAVLRRRR
jgi:uncharacterized protein (TIGR03382 family)